MKTLFFALVILIGGSQISVTDFKNFNQDAKVSIDWMWSNTGTPQKMKCLFEIVEGTTVRGYTTAHQCVVNAIIYESLGEHDKALAWLAAGQCHNSNAKANMLNNSAFCLKYIMDTYDQFVPAGTRVVSGNSQVTNIGSSANPPKTHTSGKSEP